MKTATFLFLLLISLPGIARANGPVPAEANVSAGVSAEVDDGPVKEKPSRPPFFVQGELGASLFGRLVGLENPFTTFAYGVRFGVKAGRWDFFAHVEQGFYGSPTLGDDLANSVFNAGAGVGFTYFNGHVRTSLSGGPCVLLTSTMNNDPGTVGFFAEARATELRFPLGRLTLLVNPITFSWAVPVVNSVSLVYINYRTFVGVEVEF